MSLDWCSGIREACLYWKDTTPMLQQTFDALERTLEHDNDACIDCAKAVVEVVCRLVVENFHTQQAPLMPIKENPTLSEWLSAAIRALKLGDIRDAKFKKLVASHHNLAKALNELRNKAGPASHGKNPYLKRLAIHQRRTAVLAADTIVAFLHQAYLDIQLNLSSSREPWERFETENTLIDKYVGLEIDNDYNDFPTLNFLLPGGEVISLKIEVSRLLYQIDRYAYIEVLNAVHNAAIKNENVVEEEGE